MRGRWGRVLGLFRRSPKTLRLALDPRDAIGDIDPRLFGSFVEHLGRGVYGGIYEPGHPAADARGFRQDVLDLVRTLRVPIVRYPGGNFVSGYDWTDGIGRPENRPRRQELAWKSVETNAVGTDEFVAWCRAANAEPMLAVNLGTRGPDEARALVEYCNHRGGAPWSDRRRANGHPEPHRVNAWCLGNEMDGPWQIGHKTAEDYGRLARETAIQMKAADPSIALVACGSSNPSMPTFPAWDRTVLEHTYEQVDYVSLHLYFRKRLRDRASFLAAPVAMERYIEDVARVCDQVQAAKRGRKRIDLAFDEWNVWYHSHARDKAVAPWQEAPPLLEDVYTMEDALVVGGSLIALLNHADRVRIACLAQLVNVIAPIMTRTGGPAWRQTIYWPFLHASTFGRGRALRVAVDGPFYATIEYGEAPVVGVAATVDPVTGEGCLFCVNRAARPVALTADVRAMIGFRVVEHLVLDHPDLDAVNDEAAPDRVAPRTVAGTVVDDGVLAASLPAYSWNTLRFSTTGN